MDFLIGLIRWLLYGSAQLVLFDDGLRYQRRSAIEEIAYEHVRQVEAIQHWWGSTLRINSAIELAGFPKKVAVEAKGQLDPLIEQTVIERLRVAEPSLVTAAKRITEFFGDAAYIRTSQFRDFTTELEQEVAGASPFLDHPYLRRDQLSAPLKTVLTEVLSCTRNGERRRSAHNDNYVVETGKRLAPLFAQLEKYPLTDEQIQAAIINDDRDLLVAAAGAGKTSTIIAKAIFLVEAGLAQPEEILVLAYNKDAQLELEARFAERLDISPNYQTPITARTFHGCGVEIIAQAQGRKPAISKMATASKLQFSRLLVALLTAACEKNPRLKEQWARFLTLTKTPSPDIFTIHTWKEYNDFLWELGATRQKTSEGSRLVLPTVDGKEVKSVEELRIANWLVWNGIAYEYERCYEHDTASEEHQQYYPDFYYPEGGIYHEHFALNTSGEPPAFFRNYKQGVEWKRQVHEQFDTTLIETHSANFQTGDVFEHLERSLSQHGITGRPKNAEEIDSIISQSFNPDQDAQLFGAFLRHFKSNNDTLAHVRQRAELGEDPMRATLFLDLFEGLFREYQDRLNTARESDFEDLINIACTCLERGDYKSPYRFVLVDEFQDISQDRKRLVQGLLNQHKDAQLFAVGDDWQSIYRFSGSDIDIIANFESHFGTGRHGFLTQTFRSYQGIVDVAQEFIQKNPAQIKKHVTAHEALPGEQVIVLEYDDQADHDSKVDSWLGQLQQLADDNDQRLSVFLLGRYNRQRPVALTRYIKTYPSLDIEFKTIHAAKGLEADYVLLLDVSAGAYGFPSKISDDPLLHLVIPRPEEFPDAEERRLMYVALTRAKRAAFVLGSGSSPSAFVKELAETDGVRATASFKRTNPCPDCDTGELRRIEGQFGAFYGCSNYPRCKYTAQMENNAGAKTYGHCPMCDGGHLRLVKGRYGRFLGCTGYPECKYTEPH